MGEPTKKEASIGAEKGENPGDFIEKLLITLLTSVCTNVVKMLSTWLFTEDNIPKWLRRNGSE